METVYIGFSIRVWTYAGDPDNDVHTSGGAYADIGEAFLNTNSGAIFLCTATGSGTQTWSAYTGGLPIRSQSSASRSLNSAFQISSTRDCQVTYSVDVLTSITLTSGESGTVILEIASDSGFTTDVQTLSQFTNNQTGTLTLGLSLSQGITGILSGFVPAAYYTRLRTVNNTGTPTFTYITGQEVLM